MLNPRQLLRMARWARRPPSMRQVVMVLGVLAASLLIVGAERLGLLPDFMSEAGRVSVPRVQPSP